MILRNLRVSLHHPGCLREKVLQQKGSVCVLLRHILESRTAISPLGLQQERVNVSMHDGHKAQVSQLVIALGLHVPLSAVMLVPLVFGVDRLEVPPRFRCWAAVWYNLRRRLGSVGEATDPRLRTSLELVTCNFSSN